jgi:hypothetical protein
MQQIGRMPVVPFSVQLEDGDVLERRIVHGLPPSNLAPNAEDVDL